MDRRSFVGALGALGAASVLPVGGSIVAPNRLEKIGLQLYTVRDMMKVSVERTLAAVATVSWHLLVGQCTMAASVETP